MIGVGLLLVVVSAATGRYAYRERLATVYLCSMTGLGTGIALMIVDTVLL